MDEFRIRDVTGRLSPDERVLDVGCARHDETKRAAGNLHAAISDAVEEVVGVDLVEAEVEKMRAEGYKVQVGDAEDLESIDFDSSFDVVVAGELIEHLSNPGLFLEGARHVTSADGRLVVTTPTPHCLTFTKKAAFGIPNNPEHTCWFDEQFIEQLGNRYGWSLADVTYRPAKPGLSRLAMFVSAPLGSPGFIAEFHKSS